MLIDIIHTNDIHSNIDNFGKVAHYINTVRSSNKNTLVFDSGDMITGEYQFTFNQGNIEAEITNIIDYDGYTLGNHEFDNGYTFLKQHMNKFNNPFIQSNIANPDEFLSNHQKVKYINLNGFCIGVLGFSCPYITSKFDKYPNFIDEDKLRSLVIDVASKSDAVIILSHQGYKSDVELAQSNLPIDIIIGAHSHDEIEDNHIINDTLIVQTGCFLQNIGHIKFDTTNKSFQTVKIKMVDYCCTDVKSQLLIDSTENEIKKLNLELYGRTKTKLEADRDLSTKESTNFGTLICDSYFHYAKLHNLHIDFGIINSKGIRMDIMPGLITKREIYNALPFGKSMFVLSICGKDLKKAIDENIIDIQTSNLRIDKYRKNDRIYSTLFDLEHNELVDNNYYNVMTVDYVYKSEFFSPLNKAKVLHVTEINDVDIVSNYIKTLPDNFIYESNGLVRTIK